MLLFSVDNVAMNTLRYWKQHNELLRDNGNGAMNSSAMLATAIVAGLAQPNQAVLRQVCYTGCSTKRMGKLSSAFEKVCYESHSHIGNSFPNCQKLYDVARNL
jgi:hypothetical protein